MPIYRNSAPQVSMLALMLEAHLNILSFQMLMSVWKHPVIICAITLLDRLSAHVKQDINFKKMEELAKVYLITIFYVYLHQLNLGAI